ncbi:MAG TPA: hypothetical protein VM054_07570 [bacterium]|nr:hypothetical protein [bacterium]
MDTIAILVIMFLSGMLGWSFIFQAAAGAAILVIAKYFLKKYKSGVGL